MSTTTIYADLDAYAWGYSTTYATARSTNYTAGGSPSAGTIAFGQLLLGGTEYYCDESLLVFDTPTLPDADTVTAVVFSLYLGGTDNSTTDFTAEVREHDWGGALEPADWVAGADLSGKTLLASKSTSGLSLNSYFDFTSEAGWPAALSKTVRTRLLVNSSRHREATAPTGNEYLICSSAVTAGTSQDPKLVITHTAATTWGGDMTGLSPGTTYHVRAFAVNAAGTSYGSEVDFLHYAPFAYRSRIYAQGVIVNG